jgi:quinol monooxygenase YgiN
MVMSSIELVPLDDKRQEILEILRYVAGSVRRSPACVWCGLYEGVDRSTTILYLEQWQSERDLRKHIQSRSYLPVLNAMDLARERPKVSFHEVTATRSMELIEQLRGGCSDA